MLSVCIKWQDNVGLTQGQTNLWNRDQRQTCAHRQVLTDQSGTINQLQQGSAGTTGYLYEIRALPYTPCKNKF